MPAGVFRCTDGELMLVVGNDGALGSGTLTAANGTTLDPLQGFLHGWNDVPF